MGEVAVHEVGLGPVRVPRSERFLRSVEEELGQLHGDLLSLVGEIEIVDQARDGSDQKSMVLAPSPAQRHAGVALLQRYREWFDRVRPFLARSPIASVETFDEAFATLSSYFALRRVGSGITPSIWLELFELEAAALVRGQLALLDQSRECFALLDPRAPRVFEDLSIRLEPLGGQRYRVVAESERGDAESEMVLPVEPRDVENFILRHCDPLRGAGERGWAPLSVRPHAEFGGSLFTALFTGPVRDLYMRHSAAISSGDVGLRIRLRLAAAPQLAEIPWEYLYDGTDFVALTGAVSLSRHIDADRALRPPRVEGPIRIAVTVSAPTGHAPLDSSKEIEGLRLALAPLVSAGLVRVDVAPDGTLATLAAMLSHAEVAANPFHIWHFIGHGRYVSEEEATYLAFESANGTPQMQSGFEIGTLLGAHPSLRAAVLNACEAARGAPEDSMTSIAAALASRALPAVVAMQFSVSDGVAIRFASDFYRALADGGSIDSAIADARRAIFFMPNDNEWATPVLLSRSSDGLLFDLQSD